MKERHVGQFYEEAMRVANKAVATFCNHCPDVVMTFSQWSHLTEDIKYQVALMLLHKADEANGVRKREVHPDAGFVFESEAHS